MSAVPSLYKLQSWEYVPSPQSRRMALSALQHMTSESLVKLNKDYRKNPMEFKIAQMNFGLWVSHQW